MERDATRHVEATEWARQLMAELEQRTGRTDIELTVSLYRTYDVLVSGAGEDSHPLVDFYADIQADPQRVTKALDYAAEMIQNWEATKVLHQKAKQDCLPFYERLQWEFPDLELVLAVIDFDKHFVQVRKEGERTVASFDLWPTMTGIDIERVISYIRDFEATLRREDATSAAATYSWK
ncbi:hypothetical protein LCGC14_1297110 [marine sediment metagenome]|uniref:Uncharacterized protein n=1 Tax=marine sediment metagenome TaxID=412755 RepID=A0A0F9KSC1_9ZZZZ